MNWEHMWRSAMWLSTHMSHETVKGGRVVTKTKKQKPEPCKDCLSIVLSDPPPSPITTAVCSMLLTIRLDFSEVTFMMRHLNIPCYLKKMLKGLLFWYKIFFLGLQNIEWKCLFRQVKLDGFLLMYQKKKRNLCFLSLSNLLNVPEMVGRLRWITQTGWSCVEKENSFYIPSFYALKILWNLFLKPILDIFQ